MADFPVHTIESSGKAQPLLEATQKKFGFVPNLAAVMASSPAAVEGYLTLAGIFDKTELSETERQIILMTNNRLNGCDYCMAAHTSISQAKKVPAGVIAALRENRPLEDPKLEALRVFAEAMNTKRGWVDEAEIEALLSAGYTTQTVLDVVLGTGLKVLSNYTNHVAKTPVDKAFAANKWEPAPATT